ncbi:glycosyltransferase [Candidatus Saccharibacteria bacterium]|nr:glycosyltransferase [Candidatus Saccharibacteria bacterium]
MIKLMHLIHGLSTGGAETLVKNYLLNLDKTRFDVVLVCLYHEKESPYEEIVEKSGARIIFVEDLLFAKRRKGIVSRVFHMLNKYYMVRKIIKRESPDILHTHLPLNSMVKFARPEKKTAILHTVHNDPRKLWFCSGRKRVRDYNAARWLVKHYDMTFIVLHEEMKNEIKKMFDVPDAVVLNNGVDVDKIKAAKNQKMIRNELGIPIDAFVMGHIGRFSRVKNHAFLVDVFKEVAKRNNKAFLLMVGEGLDRKIVINKLNSGNLIGRYLILDNRDDVPDLLGAMDAFVFPSLYEGLPLSLIEAQIARKPCFVSDRINEHAFISNLVVKLSIERSAAEWSDALLAYEKPKRVLVDEKNWDIKKITKKLEQIYLDALDERKNGQK